VRAKFVDLELNSHVEGLAAKADRVIPFAGEHRVAREVGDDERLRGRGRRLGNESFSRPRSLERAVSLPLRPERLPNQNLRLGSCPGISGYEQRVPSFRQDFEPLRGIHQIHRVPIPEEKHRPTWIVVRPQLDGVAIKGHRSRIGAQSESPIAGLTQG
jgi:hypothetical protein